MKNNILTILATGLVSIVAAQNTAFDYINRAPAAPANACQLKTQQQEAFLKSVWDLSDQLNNDIKNRTRAATEYARTHQDEMKAGMMRNAGLSDADVQKMQSGKDLTDAEKMELTDRMMKEKLNISLDEAKNVQSMSKEGQEAWAQNYALGQTSAGQADFSNNKAVNESNMSMVDLLAEQTALREKINAQESKLRQVYQQLDRDAEVDKGVLENELKPLFAEMQSINDGEGSTQADIDHADRLTKEIHALQDKFCNKWTPRLLDFLNQCRESTVKAIPDYDRLEEIQLEITATQTGTTKLSTGKGAYSLQCVEQFLGYLRETFRYKLYRAE